MRAALRRPPDDWGLDAAALAVCFVAASTAWRKAHDLEWPCENDLFRDMGAAQSMLDGALGADPSYLGERWWYNPLVPAVVGLTARATGAELAEGYATLGIYLNLLAPVALYFLSVRLFGRRAALATLVGFVFLGPLDEPSWLAASYSPWLWAQNFAQGVFYGALAIWLVALERKSVRFGLVAGIGLGLTVLAHTAPALILASIVAATTASELVRSRDDRAAVRRTLAFVGSVVPAAAVVAAPFWWAIAGHYGAHVRNAAPLEWIANELRFDVWWSGRDAPSLREGLALVGLVGLFVPRLVGAHARAAIATWGVLAGGGFLYGFAVERWHAPALVSSWHFYFYLGALESVLFGLGVVALARGAAWAVARRPFSASIARDKVERLVFGSVAAALFVVCALRFHAYRTRFDLVFNRAEAQRFAKLPTTKLYAWILEETKPNDVFLADGNAGFRAVMPAGRKLVSLPDIFSNPYVELAPRARDARAMYESLEDARLDDFLRAAKRYRVRYVTLTAKHRGSYRRAVAPILKRVHTSPRKDGFDAYEVLDRGSAPREPPTTR